MPTQWIRENIKLPTVITIVFLLCGSYAAVKLVQSDQIHATEERVQLRSDQKVLQARFEDYCAAARGVRSSTLNRLSVIETNISFIKDSQKETLKNINKLLERRDVTIRDGSK